MSSVPPGLRFIMICILPLTSFLTKYPFIFLLYRLILIPKQVLIISFHPLSFKASSFHYHLGPLVIHKLFYHFNGSLFYNYLFRQVI